MKLDGHWWHILGFADQNYHGQYLSENDFNITYTSYYARNKYVDISAALSKYWMHSWMGSSKHLHTATTALFVTRSEKIWKHNTSYYEVVSLMVLKRIENRLPRFGGTQHSGCKQATNAQDELPGKSYFVLKVEFRSD